mmetsp:Transcript_13989/g.27774  ORF Transcript_13989/g.27774 Transcript_13989/m.27774 type:complete len:144 (+) Transcript_13989:364-795(+)
MRRHWCVDNVGAGEGEYERRREMLGRCSMVAEVTTTGSAPGPLSLARGLCSGGRAAAWKVAESKTAITTIIAAFQVRTRLSSSSVSSGSGSESSCECRAGPGRLAMMIVMTQCQLRVCMPDAGWPPPGVRTELWGCCKFDSVG